MSIHQDLICSGYSSGAVVVWETGDRNNNVSYRELMTPDSQGIKPHVTSTAVNSTLCTAGFNNGNGQAVRIDIKMLSRPNYKYYKINVQYTNTISLFHVTAVYVGSSLMVHNLLFSV